MGKVERGKGGKRKKCWVSTGLSYETHLEQAVATIAAIV